MSTMMPFRVAVVFFALSTLQHMSFSKGLQGLQEKYKDGLTAAFYYWPLVFLGLYTVCPRPYSNLFYDCFNLMWAVVVSYLASRESALAQADPVVKKAFVEPLSPSRIGSSRRMSPSRLPLEPKITYAEPLEE